MSNDVSQVSSRLFKAAGALALVVALSGCGPSEPKSAAAPPDMRRLTDRQYHNVIADIFGRDIEVGGRTDPLTRTDGLLAVGARTARITPAGLEQYYLVAKSVAGQVTDKAHRYTLIECKPADVKAADDACAQTYLKRVGRMLYRRPLRDAELKPAVQTAHDMAIASHDFYRGVALALADMMVTPQFLFVVDETEADPNNAGGQRLTSYAKAARLSFFLWDTAPTEQMLDAAEKGDFHKASAVSKWADEMMESPRLHDGARAFFADFLGLDKFETLEKDSVIYNAFSNVVAKDAQEEVLRLVTDHVITRDQDYRDIFTTRQTFLTGPLARIYRVRVERPDGAWVPHEYAPEDRRAGILTTVGFNAVASHPGRSSPTLRGKAIRESLLCQHVPDPPGDVDFTLFEDPNSPNKTARQRLNAHATAPACAGCHKITDPIGLALENFDGIGQFRQTENGEQIDTSGDLDGSPYTDPVGLGKAMHDNAATPACVVRRLWAYAAGRAPTQANSEFSNYLDKSFASDGFRVRSLIRRIATSDAFYTIANAPTGTASETQPVQTAKAQEK